MSVTPVHMITKRQGYCVRAVSPKLPPLSVVIRVTTHDSHVFVSSPPWPYSPAMKDPAV